MKHIKLFEELSVGQLDRKYVLNSLRAVLNSVT